MRLALRCRLMRTGTVGAVLLAVVTLAACGDETSDENAGAAAGAAVGTSSTSAESSADEATESTGSAEESSSSGDGPPAPSPSTECADPEGTPDVPDESPPPTMAGDMAPGEIPNGIGGEMVPQFGELIVDVEPEGCIDIPTALRSGQRVLIHTHADDGKYTRIEIFGPDGESHGSWDTGQPETLEGWDFYNDDPVPDDGVYIFRVTHLNGSDEPFVISFYGQP
jgi:hypothetical protein